MATARRPPTMVPNRRLREELERASRQSRTFDDDDDMTRVPVEQRVEGVAPNPYGTSRIDSGEIEIDELPASPPAARRDDTLETPMPRQPGFEVEARTVVRTSQKPAEAWPAPARSATPAPVRPATPVPASLRPAAARPAPARPEAPALTSLATVAARPPSARPATPVPAPVRPAAPVLTKPSQPVVDFEEEEETRIEGGTSSIELAELMEVVEVDGRPVSPASPRRTDRGDEKSVIRRVFDAGRSVVTAMRRAMDVTGAHRLHKNKAADAEAAARPEPVRQPVTIDQKAWREMRTAPIFDGLPNEALRDALLSGDARVLKLGRDEFVPLEGAVGLVRSGQFALALFNPEVLKEERQHSEAARRGGEKAQKKERKRRFEVGPLIELSEKNLATFEEGDVVELVPGFDQLATMACFTCTPAQIICIARQRVDLWKRIYPFMADRFRRANQTARARLDATDGAKALVADFFVRHGLSVSMTLRVRKIDSCIECYACEQACEDRYGVKRLSLNGRILGGLDFVDACHTCFDQRCIDPCNFDAISFDAQRKEVLIKEDACTGCTLCAKACPYDAIEMHELDDTPLLKLRLQKENKLGHGEGTPRKARLRRIASKCDHCAFYGDQACVSACPTGALVEVLPQDVVGTLPEQARATAKAGFDRTAPINVNKLNETSAFVKGLEIPELGRARAPRTKLLIGLWWTIGLLAVAVGCVEIVLRKVWPQYSAAYWFATKVDGIDPDIAIHRVDFRPGSELAVDFGYIGTFLMISGLLYVWRRRLGFMRNWGSLRAWFDWHVMTGVVGPLFILMHSAAKLDNWVSFGFWSMVATVISGILGRYLTTELPERASTAMVETLEVDRKLATLRQAHPGLRVVDGWFEVYRRKVAHFDRRLAGKGKEPRRDRGKPTFWGAIWSVLWVMKDDLGRGRRLRALSKSLRQSVRGPGARKVRKEARTLADRLALLERRRVMLPRLEPLFRQWKAIHIPMSVVLTVVAGIHIFLELRK